MRDRYVLGIDLGGTNIKFGLVDAEGKIIVNSNLTTQKVSSNRNLLISALIRESQELIQKIDIKRKEILGIAVGLPGLIDVSQGIVRELPNVPGAWKNVPLKKIIQDQLKIPTYLENDVNLIALGEWKFGAGRGISNLVCLTLGTGVGSGLILNNSLYRGESFMAGEIGHIPLNEVGPPCNCGGSACLERAVGNKFLLQKAADVFRKKNITLEEINHLATLGQKKALKFWEETATHIGNGLVGVVNVLNPKRIIIGGGVSNAYKHLFPVITQVIKKRAMSIPASIVTIVRSQLGNNAGIMGSYALVLHESRAK